MNYKLSVVLILIALIASVLLSGCVSAPPEVNTIRMGDKELINDFCKSKGYDRGVTYESDFLDFDPRVITINHVGEKSAIVCIRTKEEQNQYQYSDLYKWIKGI